MQQRNSKLFLNRAIANSKIGRIRDAIDDCSKAINDTRMYKDGLNLRAKCYMDIRKYQCAVEDYEALLKVERSIEMETKYNEAKFQLKRFHSDNFYDRLEIEKNATDEAINRAFKRLALIHHPDKHTNSERIEQQELFKKINVAHKILSNKAKRIAYDDKTENKTF